MLKFRIRLKITLFSGIFLLKWGRLTKIDDFRTMVGKKTKKKEKRVIFVKKKEKRKKKEKEGKKRKKRVRWTP